jgi:DNA-binding response OmpR family regulator
VTRTSAGYRTEAVARVLVIDDEEPIRLLCRVNLEAAGMKVSEAEDGKAGLEAARADPPDVILLDVMMPGMDGWRVFEQLLEDEATAQVPIVFLTARAELRDQARGLELGGVDYVTKPFNPLNLAPLIEDLLARVERGEAEELRRERLAELRQLLVSD